MLEPLFEKGEWNAELGLEWRYFDDPGEFGQSQHGFSLSGRAEYYHSWNDDNDWVVFTPFMRMDSVDSERSHIDLREAFWGHLGQGWEMRLGLVKVFWGRTDFLNVVDVINQSDFVEGSTDAKLGQPMLQYTFVTDYGVLDFYALLGFRERTFPGRDGRLRTPIIVDTSLTRYGKGAGKSNPDLALRWAQPVGDSMEMAISLFSGVAREPYFAFNFNFLDPRLIPVYYHEDRVGLELMYFWGAWIGKLEAIAVEGRENYSAAVAGFEYLFGSVFQSPYDVLFLAEYLWDERGAQSPGFLEQDIGLGMRVEFNDEAGTSMLVGGMYDIDTREKLLQFEASRRIGEYWRASLKGTVVFSRGQPDLGDTNRESIETILESGTLGDDFDYDFLLDWAIEALVENGFDLVSDPTFFLEPLQQLERLSRADRKLSILESDSYLQLDLVYYF